MLVGLTPCAEPGGAGGGDVPTELPAGSAPSPLAPRKVLATVPPSSALHTAENHCWNKLEGKKIPGGNIQSPFFPQIKKWRLNNAHKQPALDPPPHPSEQLL